MTESDYKAKVVRMLKEKGFWVYVPSDRMHRGIPDILSLAPSGKIMAIELKLMTKRSPSPKLSALQELNLLKIARNNGISVILTVNETDKNLESILQPTYNLYSYCIEAKNVCKKKFISTLTKLVQ